MIPFLEPQRELRPTTFAEPSENVSFGERLTSLRKYLPENIAAEIGKDPRAFSDLWGAADRQNMLVENEASRNVSIEQAYDRRIAGVKAATGVELENPLRGGLTASMIERARQGDLGEPVPDEATAVQLFEQRLAELRDKHPDKLNALTFGDVRKEAEAIAKGSDEEYERAKRETPLSPGAALVAEFAGGFTGQRRSPLFVGSMFLGPTSAVGKTVAARIATSSLFQGFYNAGISALEQPAVQQWRSEIGVKSGVMPAIENVGMAFLFGAIPGAALRGLHELGAVEKAALQRVTTGRPEAGDIEKVAARIGEGEPVQAQAIRLGEEMDEAAKITTPRPAKDVSPELYDDLTTAAQRYADDPINQPSPEAVAVLNSLQIDPKWRPRNFDEDRAWYHIRDLFPDMSEQDMQRIADHVERLTGGGVSPAPERPSGLKLMKEWEVSEEGVTERAVSYTAMDEQGSAKVRVRFEMDKDTATLVDINALDASGNTLPTEQARNIVGPAEIRSLLRQFRGEHPEVKRIIADRVSGARTGGKYDVMKGQEIQIELADRIAAARPETQHEAQMAASEALEDIGNRDTIARTRAQMENDRLPTFTLDETFAMPPARSKDPLDKLPMARDDGTPTMVSHQQAARAGERETKFADIIRECK